MHPTAALARLCPAELMAHPKNAHPRNAAERMRPALPVDLNLPAALAEPQQWAARLRRRADGTPWIGVCFVCLGNICRSPTAEGIFIEQMKHYPRREQIIVDSAGTSGAHQGAPADTRSQATAHRRGITLRTLSRPILGPDFERFDLLVAMDRSNLGYLERLKPEGSRAHACLLRDFDPEANGERDVPDPYYDGDAGFERVFDMCWRSSEMLGSWLNAVLSADETSS